MNIGAVIVAAGRGERAGQSPEGPKQYRQIGGEAVLLRTLHAFIDCPYIHQIIVVLHPEDKHFYAQAVGNPSDKIIVTTGGPTRQESTRLGLLTLSEYQPDFVLIHDAVRPFISQSLLQCVVQNLHPTIGVLPALMVCDTLKQVGADAHIQATIPRTGLFTAQTPQAFPFVAILEAHEAAFRAGKFDCTDDAAIAEWYGMPVQVIAGSVDNIKLTCARDIEMADKRLYQDHKGFPDIRTGHGYDVHAFGHGDHVTLCGVKIPHVAKLIGHSDADVALHALTDAFLATRGAGDIGTHFPPSDPQWREMGSYVFVEHAIKIIRKAGGRIINIDITLICEAPTINPYRNAMVATLANMLTMTTDRISIKATTNEKLGFIGRREGIAAIATANVLYSGEVPG